MTSSKRTLATAASLVLASGAAIEERIDGYEVTYAYAGREYVTRMPYDPGERLRVRGDVTPADG